MKTCRGRRSCPSSPQSTRSRYCLNYADRAVGHGFPSLVVLGGDSSVGPPRCVEHAWQLRQAILSRQPRLALGGWANPHRPAASQVAFLQAPEFTASFALTQVVSHHQLDSVDALLGQRGAW